MVNMQMFEAPEPENVHELRLPAEFVAERRKEQQVRNWVKVILLCTFLLFAILVTW